MINSLQSGERTALYHNFSLYLLSDIADVALTSAATPVHQRDCDETALGYGAS